MSNHHFLPIALASQTDLTSSRGNTFRSESFPIPRRTFPAPARTLNHAQKFQKGNETNPMGPNRQRGCKPSQIEQDQDLYRIPRLHHGPAAPSPRRARDLTIQASVSSRPVGMGSNKIGTRDSDASKHMLVQCKRWDLVCWHLFRGP